MNEWTYLILHEILVEWSWSKVLVLVLVGSSIALRFKKEKNGHTIRIQKKAIALEKLKKSGLWGISGIDPDVKMKDITP